MASFLTIRDRLSDLIARMRRRQVNGAASSLGCAALSLDPHTILMIRYAERGISRRCP
jgi:hypothetical protein